MNPGPGEEASKALSTIADVMKAQPLALGFILTSVMWLVFLFWFASKLNDRNVAERKYFIDEIKECKEKHDHRP